MTTTVTLTKKQISDILDLVFYRVNEMGKAGVPSDDPVLDGYLDIINALGPDAMDGWIPPHRR